MVAEPQVRQEETSSKPVTHPLDQLTENEIRAAAALLRADSRFTPSMRFVSIALQEPAKDLVRAFRPGDAIRREAFAIIHDRAARETHEAVVSLTDATVTSWRHVPDVQPYFIFEDMKQAMEAVKADPDWQAAVRKRGLEDVEKTIVAPWPSGNFGWQAEKGRRIARAISYFCEDPDDNYYAHPIEGVIAIVDLDTLEVMEVQDHGIVPLARTRVDYYGPHAPEQRNGLKPLEITQPEGVSFEIDGHCLSWQKWSMHVAFHPREGLVLHDVCYEDKGHRRPVLYRAALSEMVVPYGDPAPGQFWKNAFDAGEVGVGRTANSLELGCDCLGEIRYLDAVLSDAAGEPLVRKNAVCIHEEDFSILWTHNESLLSRKETRRSRRLVISFFATVGNYDYGFYWYFYQDGSIETDVKMTGILQTMGVADGEELECGTIIGKNLGAPNHQHFFCFRLDMDVDGASNSVYEMSTCAGAESEANAYGNMFGSKAELLSTEKGGIRDVDPLSGRHWRVVNPGVKNAWGQNVAYNLMPGESVAMFAAPWAAVSKRAAFARHQLWVTPFEPAERYAAGDYPVQHPGGAGLPEWTENDRPLEDRDLVLWYTVGANHIARPEDWPVMPVHAAGFALRPFGFFDMNPAIDVPPPVDHCHD
jgi:primary-amine oxidase